MMVPPIVNQYLNLTKDSSLAIAIGYMDVVATIGGISLMQTGRELETMIIILGVYLALSLTIALSMRRFHRTTRRRAGRETQARARRAPSVAMRFDEAVAVREVAGRRIGVGSLARLWEAGEQACESGVEGVLRLRWREPGRSRVAVLESREALEALDLSRAVSIDFEGLEIRGKSHRIWIRERAPVTMLGVVTARPNHLEFEVRGSEVRSRVGLRGARRGVPERGGDAGGVAMCSCRLDSGLGRGGRVGDERAPVGCICVAARRDRGRGTRAPRGVVHEPGVWAACGGACRGGAADESARRARDAVPAGVDRAGLGGHRLGVCGQVVRSARGLRWALIAGAP